MTRHLDLAPGAANDAAPVDQEGAAVNPDVLAAIHAFLNPNAITLGNLAGCIGSEDKRERVLLLEPVVCGDRVARHADHRRAGPAEIRERVAKAAGFGGAAG